MVNGHRLPPDYMPIRLEIHANGLIPALYWYRLVSLEKEHYIKTDQEIRKKQGKYVQHPLHPQSARAGGKSMGIWVKR